MYSESKVVPVAEAIADDVRAVIKRSDSGGPVRMIINGRRDIPTGLFLAVKGGWRQMPWESKDGELAAMHIAEASSGVTAFISQPHHLEMRVSGKARPYDYFPDLEMTVTCELLESLRLGTPFGEAALSASGQAPPDDLATIVVELKGKDDPRIKEKNYARKLELAEQVYAAMGMRFFIMRHDEHIDDASRRRIRDIVLDARSAVTSTDSWVAHEHIARRGGRSTYGALCKALGSKSKLHALHVRRVVGIDLTKPIGPSSTVRAI